MEEAPYIVVEDLDGGKFSIYDNITLELASLDGRPQEGLDKEVADSVLDILEARSRVLRLVKNGGFFD